MSVLTVQKLRDILVERVGHLVGTYTIPGSSFATPALRIGDPPSNWTVTGIEIIIPTQRDLQSVPLQHREVTWTGAIPVRVIQHANAPMDPVIERILRRWPHATARHIPATDEVLAQTVIHIPVQ